jgi:hypothetical protein
MTVDLWDDELEEMVSVLAVCESYSWTAETGCYCALNPGCMCSYGFGPICSDWQMENLPSAECPGAPPYGGQEACSEFCSPNPACGGYCDQTAGVWYCECGEWDFDPPGPGDPGNEQGASGQWPVCQNGEEFTTMTTTSCGSYTALSSHIGSFVSSMYAPIDELIAQPITTDPLQPPMPLTYTMEQLTRVADLIKSNDYMTQQNAADGGGDYDTGGGPDNRVCYHCGGACSCVGNTNYTAESVYCYKGAPTQDYNNQTDPDGVAYWDGGAALSNAVYEGNCAPWYWFERYDEGQGGTYCAPNCPNPYEQYVGCTDSNAENYNSEAQSDDGSCWYIHHYDNPFGGGSVPTIKVGRQLWTMENVKRTAFNNLVTINYEAAPCVNNNWSDAGAAQTPAHGWYFYDDACNGGFPDTGCGGGACDGNGQELDQTIANHHGYLYNGYVVEESQSNTTQGGVCPCVNYWGASETQHCFHIPSRDEMNQLLLEVGGSVAAANITRGSRAIRGTGIGYPWAGDGHWISGNTGTNTSRLDYRGGGIRRSSQDMYRHYVGYWWLDNGTSTAEMIDMNYTTDNVTFIPNEDKSKGAYIRCVYDLDTQPCPDGNNDPAISC